MAFLKNILIVLASVLVTNECAFVDTLKKCYVKDSECLKNLIQDVIKKIPKYTGIPEMGIDSIDPVKVKNVEINIKPNILTFKLIEGEVIGISDCIVNSFSVDLEKLRVTMEIMGDIVITGNYNVFSDSSLFKSLFDGKSISGNGHGKLKIDKLKINLDFSIKIKQRDGQYYLMGDLKKLKYTYDILDKLELEADNLMLGDTESSKKIVPMINENWKLLVSAIGNEVFEVAVKVCFEFVQNIFTKSYAKDFILDDLSQYVH